MVTWMYQGLTALCGLRVGKVVFVHQVAEEGDAQKLKEMIDHNQSVIG